MFEMFAWVTAGLLGTLFATLKGYKGLPWLIIGIVAGPLAFAIACALTREGEREGGGFRPCPACAEPIRTEAKLCPFCRSPAPERAVQNEQ